MVQKSKISFKKKLQFAFQSKADHRGSKKSFFGDFRLIEPKREDKMLPIDNIVVQKLNTYKTQILHTIRLRKYKPEKHLYKQISENSLAG